MGRWFAQVCMVGLLLATVSGHAADEQVASAQVARPGDEPNQLVRQLGDRSFSVRRQATARLVELGVESIAALEQGVHSEDREISFRSRHVLQIVRENDFQRRLRAFANGTEAAESYRLPGWVRFAKEVGTGPAARALFVEMQQAEPELLTAVDAPKEAINEIVAQRITILQSVMALGRESDLPSKGTIAAILFVLNCHDVELPLVLTQSIGSYFRYPNFAEAIQSGSHRDLLRKMLGTWIERARGWDAYHAMFLSMQYGMSDGLVPAKRILEGELQQQNQSHFLCYALLTYARFGDTSHYELIEPLLDDKTPYGGTVAIAGNVKSQTQIRDIALATLVHLAKLDHKEFGFLRYRSHTTLVFNTSTLAFESDEKREEAIQKWREYRRENGE